MWVMAVAAMVVLDLACLPFVPAEAFHGFWGYRFAFTKKGPAISFAFSNEGDYSDAISERGESCSILKCSVAGN